MLEAGEGDLHVIESEAEGAGRQIWDPGTRLHVLRPPDGASHEDAAYDHRREGGTPEQRGCVARLFSR